MGKKVIIDIPKIAFESVKSDEPMDFLDAMHIISTIQNGIPLEEELNKIKAEIHSDIYQGSYFNKSGLERAEKIIDREISQLKGE